MPDPIGRDERLDDWVRREFGDAFVRYSSSSLFAMTLAMNRDHAGVVVPPEVMTAWHKEIAASRRAAAQAEERFINKARHQGWTWDRIAAVLGLESADVASSRRTELQSELDRTNPSHMPIPWTG